MCPRVFSVKKYQGSLESLSAQEFFRWTGQCGAGQAAGQVLETGSDGGPESLPEEVTVSLLHRESSERPSGQRGSKR